MNSAVHKTYEIMYMVYVITNNIIYNKNNERYKYIMLNK